MSKEIKPGMLCILRGIDDPAENNGKIVEVLRFEGYDNRLCENVWWIKARDPITAYVVIEFWGREWQVKKLVDEPCMAKQSTLLPISDPDMETDDVTTKEDSEVLQ